MTWATEVMLVMVANSLPTGYTAAVHQFLAQHFDYGRNLVVIDLLSVKKAHCGFMILLCNEGEMARVAESKVVADDGSINRSNHIPTDLLFFYDQAGGVVHYPAGELDEYISQKVAKEWLFAGASIHDASLLHKDYDKHLLDLDLQCLWQEKKYRDVNVASCTASSALAQAVLVHKAGWTVFLDVFKAAGVLSLSDVAAVAGAGAEHEVYYSMTEDRNKFMAYCMVMREGVFCSSDKVAFNWPGEVDDHDKIEGWGLDKLSMALCYPLVNKNVFSGNPGLVGLLGRK